MKEKLLHFIWKYQYFNKNYLETLRGEPLDIIFPGNYNVNQGADFSEAIIKIGTIILAGNIELHVKASDWQKHHHSTDSNYSNIILHVVWEADMEIFDLFSNPIPTLELQTLVPKLLITRYEQLMKDTASIPCSKYLPVLNELGWIKWKESLALGRMLDKAARVEDLFTASNNHWEEVFWWVLASAFGSKVNAELFENVAKSLPVNLLARHKNQLHQLEALLLGQANLLEADFEESYPVLLQKEYRFLQKKYKLKKISFSAHFLRMRPANFPTIRLAQLAMLIYQSKHLFATLKDIEGIQEVKKLFDITCNDYWHYHYTPEEITSYKPKHIGKQMIDIVIINAVVPVLFAYGKVNGEETVKTKALQWLSDLRPESNSIITGWEKSGITCKNALESQALLQLQQHYCNQKKCLQCSVGHKLLRATN